MLKLKLQYFGHLMQRVDSLEKTLMLGGIGGRRLRDNRGWDGWMASLTQWTWVWVNSGSRWWTGRPGVLWFMGSQRVGHDWATELNWTKQGLEVQQHWTRARTHNEHVDKHVDGCLLVVRESTMAPPPAPAFLDVALLFIIHMRWWSCSTKQGRWTEPLGSEREG